MLGREWEPGAIHLDLEQPDRRTVIENFQEFVEANRNKLIILDEAQCDPDMFPKLKAQLDKLRGDGSIQTKFLLLGSATAALDRLAGRHLDGRMAYIDLAPFQFEELRPSASLTASQATAPTDLEEVAGVQDRGDVQTILGRLWLRGGYPLSYNAQDENMSLEWRCDYVRAVLSAQDTLGANLTKPDLLTDFWKHLCIQQGNLCKPGRIAGKIGCKQNAVEEMLRFLCSARLIRKIRPWFANEGKRERLTSRVFIRDSGLLHAH